MPAKKVLGIVESKEPVFVAIVLFTAEIPCLAKMEATSVPSFCSKEIKS
jgi:hypothetical protein